MVLTPSAKGAFLAGIGFWTLLWLGVAKLDEIAECLHLRKFLGTEKCLAWINRHRALSLLGTEAMNYGSHGIQPLGVSFAIGGSNDVLRYSQLRELLPR